MRNVILTLVLALGGCENAAESLVEAATGTEIERDGETVTIKTKDGEITTTTNKDGAKTVVTGRDGEKAVYDSDDKTIRMQTKDGTVEIGGTEVPAGFPLPVPDGAKILSSTHVSKKGNAYQVSLMSDKSPGDLADFYAKAIAAKGLQVKRNEMKMGARMMINLHGKKKKLQVSAAFMEQEDGKTQAMISWQE